VPLLGHSGPRGRPGRVLASVALVTAVTALGLCAGFANASPLGRVSSHNPTLSVTPRALGRIVALAPGDHAERTLELHYRGRFAAVVLTTRISGSSFSDPSGGLHLTMERCSKRWTMKRGTRAYVCHGRRWSALKTVRFSGKRQLRLLHLSRRAGRTDHLRLTVSLLGSAGNTLQGQTARVVYRLTGIAAG
jgi:hypothetical protein